MSDKELNKAEEVPAKVEEAAAPAQESASSEASPAPAAEAPKPKLAAGFFKDFTLGSHLEQGAKGNVMTNMKKPPMDYEKAYQQSTKNQQMTAEQLQESLKPKK